MDTSNVTTVLVTGATGFVAGHVIDCLLRNGHSVRGSVRDISNKAKVQHLMALDGSERLSFVQANLSSPEDWTAACAGCSHVLHVASPAPASVPKHEDDLVKPAVEGTLNVLKAAKAAGIKRVVVTSSNSAISAGHDELMAKRHVFTEKDWANWENAGPFRAYAKSKTLAEQAAHKFCKDNDMECATINPVLVLGPMLSNSVAGSLVVVRKLMNGEMPGIPNLHWKIVDVRDVAEAHYRAMLMPGVAGERFLVSSAESLWMKEVAALLRQKYASQGFAVPSMMIPNFVVRALALVDPNIRLVVANLGKVKDVSTKNAETKLNMRFRSAGEAIMTTAKCMVDRGIAKKRQSLPLPLKLLRFVLLLVVFAGILRMLTWLM